MKRFALILVAAGCLLSLTACGNQNPSLDEVEQAISSGNVTLQDALDKGWITQEWADEYVEEKTVPAGDKMESGAVGDFKTTTLAGEEFTKEQIGNVSLVAFLDPNDPDAQSFFESLVKGYDGVKETGAEIIVCTKETEKNELFKDAPFPVILYNDSMKAAVEKYSDMIDETPNIGSWYVDGSFVSAWYSTITDEDLANTAASFVEMRKEMDSENDGNSGDAAGVIG